MNSIDQTISAAAAFALQGVGTFIHESQAQATLTANNATLPAIVYGTATTGQQQASSRVEAATVSVYFAAATPGAGDDAAATLATQQQMQTLKRRFLTVLDDSPYVQVDGIKATPMAGIYEAVLDGVGCQFTLTVPANPLLIACLPGAVSPPVIVVVPPVTPPTVTNATFTSGATTATTTTVTPPPPPPVGPIVANATFVAQ